jgi:hypothetical protein
MGAAALPARTIEHAGDGVDQGLVGVADDQLDAGKATGDQAAQKPSPAGAVLGSAQLQAKDLAVPCGVDPGGDQRGGVDHSTHLTDLDVEGVQPDEHIGAGIQRPVAPGRDQLIQLTTDPGDLGFGQTGDPHGLGDVLGPSGGDALDIALGDHRGQGPLGPPAGLQERGQVAALADPGDLQVDRADPSVPIPGPVAVAVGGSFRGALAVLGADLGAHLGVHQRLGEHPHALAQEVDIAAVGLAQQLQQFHGGHGHRDSPLDVLIEPFTSRTYAVATLISEPGACSYTNPWDAITAVSKWCDGVVSFGHDR